MPYKDPAVRREKHRIISARWRRNHPGAASKAVLKSRAKYPEKYAELQRNRNRKAEHERAMQNPEYRIRRNLRRRLNHALHGVNRAERTMSLLGCTIDQFLGHLEINFREGMSWENYGKVWHIDHVRPCASFNLTDPAQQKECFHWKNLQPLFAKDNHSKGAKWIGDLANKEAL